MLYDFPRDRDKPWCHWYIRTCRRLNGILLICSFVFIAACGYAKRGICYDSCACLPHGASKLFGVLLIRFLANVNSRSRSVHVRYLLSPVCLSSVCNAVQPTQAVEIFGNISTAFGTLAIRRHAQKKRGVAKYSDFGPIEGYISETAQDTR